MIEKPLIFLSSTWLDLENHRKAILLTLARLQRNVEAMEYFGAGSKTTLEESIERVKKSNIYVGVFGTRYGTANQEKKSISQLEYEAAVQNGLKILIYLIDEDNQAVYPKFIDKGKKAKQLRKLKKRLKQNHLCTFFTSPEDLAVKVGIDLINVMQVPNNRNTIEEEIRSEVPKLIMESGFTYGFERNHLDISGLIEIDDNNTIRINDNRLQLTISAGYIATELNKGNFECLKHFLTFDKDYWDLVLLLVKHFGIDQELLAKSIRYTNDPLQYRLLVNIAGRLKLSNTCEDICKSFLFSNLDSRLLEFRQPITPITDVVKEALSSFSEDCIPMIEKYETIAKTARKWKKKNVFKSAVKELSKS